MRNAGKGVVATTLQHADEGAPRAASRALSVSAGWQARVLAAAPYLVLLALCAWSSRHTVDDAYISFRYSQNFAHGHGLVYNVGERVEGYSNPLWVYILTLPALLGIDLAVSAKLLGVAFACATLWLFARALRRYFGVSTWLAFGAQLFFAGHISLVYYATAGLETVLYTCLVLGIVTALLESKYTLAAGAAGLAALARPEGVMLLVVPAFAAWRAAPAQRVRAWLSLCLPLALVAAQVCFRRAYYGTWVPNTFHAKAVSPFGAAAIIEHVRMFISGSAAWAWAHLAFGVLGVFGVLGTVLFLRTIPAWFLTIGLLSTFVLYAKFDWMAFGRFYLPILPLWLVVAFAAINELLRRARSVNLTRWSKLGTVVLVMCSWGASARALVLLDRGELYEPALSLRRHYEPARYIRDHSRPGDVLAAPEIGLFAYVSGLRTIDMFGLTDARIPALLGPPEAWTSLSQETLAPYAAYVLAERPRFVALLYEAEMGGDNLDPLMRSLHTRMQQIGGYKPALKHTLNRDFDVVIFIRDEPRTGAEGTQPSG